MFSDRARPDVVVVGAGIVGLAHAVQCARRGLSVQVIERDKRAVGASVRNFGHGCITGQAGSNFDRALRGRSTWIELAGDSGLWLAEAGTVVAARSELELAVLDELTASGHGDARMLDAGEVKALVPLSTDVVGGAHLPLDIRVDPRHAVEAIAAWLGTQRGVEISWSTTMLGVEGDTVRTSRGDVVAGRTIVCVGHDVDRLFPDMAERAGVERCRLHMLRVGAPFGGEVSPAVLTGSSMLRYPAFRSSPSWTELQARFQHHHSELVAAGLNLMFTQLPNGDLTIGDTHQYATTFNPYRDETFDRLVLDETARLLGVDSLDVRERWEGVYASGPDVLVAEATPTTTIVSVTSGIGMTIAHGLAEEVVERRFSSSQTVTS